MYIFGIVKRIRENEKAISDVADSLEDFKKQTDDSFSKTEDYISKAIRESESNIKASMSNVTQMFDSIMITMKMVRLIVILLFFICSSVIGWPRLWTLVSEHVSITTIHVEKDTTTVKKDKNDDRH